MRIQDDDGHSIITFFSEDSDSAIWVVGNILMVMNVTRRDGSTGVQHSTETLLMASVLLVVSLSCVSSQHGCFKP